MPPNKPPGSLWRFLKKTKNYLHTWKKFGFSSDQNQRNVMHDNISTRFVKVDCTSHWNCIIQYIYRGPVLYTVAIYIENV